MTIPGFKIHLIPSQVVFAAFLRRLFWLCLILYGYVASCYCLSSYLCPAWCILLLFVWSALKLWSPRGGKWRLVYVLLVHLFVYFGTSCIQTIAWYHDPSSSGSLDTLFTRLLYYTKCKNRKRDIIEANNRTLPKVNQVTYIFGHILHAKYHYPSTSGSPNILVTRFQRFPMQKSRKEDNSATTSTTEKKVWVRLFFIFVLYV